MSENPFNQDIQEGWGDDDQRPAELSVEFMHIHAGESRIIVVLSSLPIFYKGHFDPQARRMRRCVYPDWCPSEHLGKSCPYSALGPPRPRFIVVAWWQARQWLWEFGKDQRDLIRPLFEARGGDLAGLPLLLKRPPGRNKPPVWVGPAAEEEAPPGPYPEVVDAKAIVYGVWARQSLKRGVKAGGRPLAGEAGLPGLSDSRSRPRSGHSGPPGGGELRSPIGALPPSLAADWVEQERRDADRLRIFGGAAGENEQESEQEEEAP